MFGEEEGRAELLPPDLCTSARGPLRIPQVLKGLVSSGMVCAIPPQHSGKSQLMYIISNRYFRGEAFPRKERAEKKEEEEKEVRARLLPSAVDHAFYHNSYDYSYGCTYGCTYGYTYRDRSSAISSSSGSATSRATRSCCACSASPRRASR